MADSMLRLAGRRKRALVLLYHDIGEEGSKGGVVRVITRRMLRRHIQLLVEIGDVVPLADLLADPGAQRPRFAITFDDDSASYAKYAVQELSDLGVRATFFLSGRSLHGMRPYWWDMLDWWIAERGLLETADFLGAPHLDARGLAAWCEGREAIERLYEAVPADAAKDRLLDPGDIRMIAASGMDIGFHTLRHRVLPDLDDLALETALREGRADLEAAVGRSIDLLSYPHGRTDTRVAAAARRAGYRAAFGSRGRPITAESPRMSLDRWEPGRLEVGALLGEICWRLNRPPA
jgi:peptidoglycan/xylan/chitin deacetylase (PgdA/CDA1 family)